MLTTSYQRTENPQQLPPPDQLRQEGGEATTNATATIALLGARVCQWARTYVGRHRAVQYERLTKAQTCGACGQLMRKGERVIAYLHPSLPADTMVYMHEACEGEEEN